MPIEIVDMTPTTYLGSRPDWLPPHLKGMAVNKKTGQVRVMTERGIVVNSQLRRDEWQQLETDIQQAALQRLRAVSDLTGRGLTQSIGSLGVLTTQWSQVSELTGATVSMSGQSNAERDRLDFKIAGRPVPVISKEFMIPKRQLEAARLGGMQLDTATGMAASRVVAEEMESMLIDGNAAVVFDGNTIYGYRTEPNRNTSTAAALGGGDWGTISNIIPTVAGMVNAAAGDRYYGPFMLYASTTQYNQATLAYYSDVGDTPRERILKMPQIAGFEVLDLLADGELILAQMTKDVVAWAEHMGITVVEWMAGDGMVSFFKVLAVATPEVKSEYNSRSGIVHVTGA